MTEKMRGETPPSKEQIPEEIEILRKALKRELGMELAEFNENGQRPVKGYEYIQFTRGNPENKWAWSSAKDDVQSSKFTLGEADDLRKAGEKLAEGIRLFRANKIEWMQLSQENR